MMGKLRDWQFYLIVVTAAIVTIALAVLAGWSLVETGRNLERIDIAEGMYVDGYYLSIDDSLPIGEGRYGVLVLRPDVGWVDAK